MFTNITLLFVILLFPLAGFIAWAGDRIGHRTGKKRHTLLGLRPRHTATLFTIGAGVLIVAVSFGTFWLSSESFRMVVQKGETLYRNNLRLKQENQAQAEAITLARRQELRIRDEASKFNEERVQAENARTQALAGLATARRRQTEAEKRVYTAEQRYYQAVARLTTAQTELQQARGAFNAVQNDLHRKTNQVHQVENELRSAQRRYKTAEADRKIAEAQRREAEKDARDAQRTALSLVRDADAQRRRVEEELTGLRGRLKEQENLYTQLQEQTGGQRLELARLTRELEEKRAEYLKVAASTMALRGRQITYQVGEEVDRIPIRPGYSVWRIQAVLEAFLTTASRKAESKGAARGRESRAVIIPPVPFSTSLTAVTSANSGKPGFFSEEDALSEASKAIRQSNEDVLVVAVAQANAVAGEPVAVKLEIYRNPVVLGPEVKLAEISVNGEGSRQEVADAIYNFLNHDVHRRLVGAGMIPIAKGGDSSAGGSDVPRLEEFTLSGQEWLELMDRVRNAGPHAKIIAYAAKELRAGDPVALRFDVKGHPTPLSMP